MTYSYLGLLPHNMRQFCRIAQFHALSSLWAYHNGLLKSLQDVALTSGVDGTELFDDSDTSEPENSDGSVSGSRGNGSHNIGDRASDNLIRVISVAESGQDEKGASTVATEILASPTSGDITAASEPDNHGSAEVS